MRTWNLLLASLFVGLYGCQPETPAQPPAGAAMESSTTAVSVEPAVPAAMTPASAPAPAAEPASAPKPAPAAQEKPAAVKEKPAAPPAAMTPAPAVVAPPAKVEAAPAAATKPEAKAILPEADALALAKKSGCLVCHAVDRKVVGPAWKDVAAKYRGDAGAEARLMDKVAKGGGGVWGNMAMPANPKVSEADRQALVRFVLSLK